MTAEALAELAKARRIGKGRWLTRCPAHDDRSPSLSIGNGQDGRVLLRCWAGCRTGDILAALGLGWRALFPNGPPPSPAEMARVAREREAAAAQWRKERAIERSRDDRTRRLEAVLSELGKRRMLMPDGAPEENALIRLYHETLDKLPDRQMSDEELIHAMNPEEKSPAANGAVEVPIDSQQQSIR
jgi:hypothetical protein